MLKTEVMRVLGTRAMALFEIAAHIAMEASAGELDETVDELTADGYLVSETVDGKTVYRHAYETAMSDLSGKLLPHRDPVREAHEHEATQERRARYRRSTLQGADLGDDD